jgi:hypothetical protein
VPQFGDLATLGGDVLPNSQENAMSGWSGFVLTRLHARYGKNSLGEDLVFRAAPPILGGREFMQEEGKLETSARPSEGGQNFFQARYAIRHPWAGKISCFSPKRGIWEGPPPGYQGSSGPKVAQDLAFAPRGGITLASLVEHDVPEIGLKAAAPSVEWPGAAPRGGGCASCWVGEDGGGPWQDGTAARYAVLAALAGGAGLVVRRRRRRDQSTKDNND